MTTESDQPFQYNNTPQQIFPPAHNGQAQYFPNQNQPHLGYYPEPNRREMGSWLKSILLMGAGATAVVATEKIAPKEYKVSTLLGTFEAEIETQVQGQVKDIETYYASALEDYKGEVSTFVEASNSSVRAHNDAILQYYKAAYDRAQVLTQGLVNMRAFIVQKFANIAEQLNSTDLGISSGALAIGRLIQAFDPDLGDILIHHGTEGGDLAAKRLEDYINRGFAIEMPILDNSLPSPESVQDELDDIELPESPEPPKLTRYIDRDIGGAKKDGK
jgi:hypothetical protein